MSQSAGVVSQNTKLYYHNGTAYIEIAEVSDIDPGNLEVTKVYFPRLHNANYVKSKKPGQIDAGDVKIEANFTRSNATLLLGFLTSRQVKQWRVELSDDISGGATQGTRWDFEGFVSNLQPFKASDDERLTTSFEICVVDLGVLTEAPP